MSITSKSGPAHVTVSRKTRFSAAHFYYLPELSEEENVRKFYGCANRHGHGHNYEVIVAVSGPIDPETGMVVNLKDLKVILDEEVVGPMDHKNLNHQVEYFAERLPTLENIALYIWGRLTPRMAPFGLTLQWIKVVENDTLYVEYYGDLHRDSA
jgi:6-pyruvoyltetrahydropterin/6-carboxytetrahydropterin synthase